MGGEGTPADWSLPGAIYLSPERQKQLGFKTLVHLPNDALRYFTLADFLRIKVVASHWHAAG